MKWIQTVFVAALIACACAAGPPEVGAQTVSVTGEADVSDLQAQIDAQQKTIDQHTAELTKLTARLDTSDGGETGGNDGGSSGGGGNDGGNSGGGGSSGGGGDKETDLWLNVSHYRFTPVIEYVNGEYVITDPRFVDLMSRWSGIRYLNWTGQLNHDINWNWDTRVTEQHRDRPGGWDKTGVPLEAIIAVANATHTHVWWTAPQQADMDYMRRAGELFARTLDQDLDVVVEISNEVWQSNRGWRYDELSGGDFGLRMKLYAEDSAAKFAAFGEHFPAARLTRVISGQLHNIGVLKSNALRHIDPADYDAISCSGYFGNSPATWLDGPSGLNASLKYLAQHAELARSKGKRLLIYEINQHANAGTDDMAFVDTDPIIGGVRTMITAARDEGATEIAVYSGVGKVFTNAPFPIYSTDYRPRRIVTELGWPTLTPTP